MRRKETGIARSRSEPRWGKKRGARKAGEKKIDLFKSCSHPCAKFSCRVPSGKRKGKDKRRLVAPNEAPIPNKRLHAPARQTGRINWELQKKGNLAARWAEEIRLKSHPEKRSSGEPVKSFRYGK